VSGQIPQSLRNSYLGEQNVGSNFIIQHRSRIGLAICQLHGTWLIKPRPTSAPVHRLLSEMERLRSRPMDQTAMAIFNNILGHLAGTRCPQAT